LLRAAVLRGIKSYGHTGRVHTAKVLRLAEHMPLVVEIVDSEEKIEAFLPVLDDMFKTAKGGGLVTLEAVEIISYPPTKGE
jgi:PII-like signaling protein